MNNILQKHKKTIIIISIITIIFFIILILIWPLINQGTINISINQPNTKLSICQTTTGYVGNSEYGCSSEDMSEFSISTNEYTSKLKSGTYFFQINKEGYQDYNQEINISIFQTNEIAVNLIPLPRKITDNQVISLFNNESFPQNPIYIADTISQNPNEDFKFTYQVRQFINQQEKIIMTIDNLAQISQTLWSPDQSKVIVWAIEKNTNNSQPQKFIIDINQQTIAKSAIPSDQIAWSSDSKKIYYIFTDIITQEKNTPPTNLPEGAGWVPTIILGKNNNTLTMANPDGTDWQNIIKLDEQNIFNPKIVPSPDGKKLILISNNHKAFLFDYETNIVSQFTPLENIVDISWSPDSQYILLEELDEKNNPQIYSTNINFDTIQPTGLKTFLSKTTWINNIELISAIPNYLEQGPYSELPQTIDYFKITNFNLPSDQTDFPFQTTKFNNTDQVADSAINLTYNINDNSLYYIDYYNNLYIIPKQ